MTNNKNMRKVMVSLFFVVSLLTSLSTLMGVGRAARVNTLVSGVGPSPSESVAWTPNGTVICNASLSQWGPQIVSDGAGGAIIVWYDNRTGSTYDIYAQRVNSAGVNQWGGYFGIAICTEAENQDLPSLTSDGAGGAIIAWEDNRTGYRD
ncbi:MAG: 5'-nucleotidase, partial [Promethearchaeota archaeon CR_4]